MALRQEGETMQDRNKKGGRSCGRYTWQYPWLDSRDVIHIHKHCGYNYVTTNDVTKSKTHTTTTTTEVADDVK
jgi:hypothetical protein